MSDQPKTHWEVECLEDGTRVVVADPASVCVEGKRYRFKRVPEGYTPAAKLIRDYIASTRRWLIEIGQWCYYAALTQAFSQSSQQSFPIEYVDKLIEIGTELKRIKGDQP